jgi:hypothetical protein
MTSTLLARQQHDLVQALWLAGHDRATDFLAGSGAVAPSPQWQRGLLAYRSNGIELAQRALRAAYPVAARLLGDDNFRPIAVRLWRENPPVRGDLAQWGGGLAALIESIGDLQREEPWLADVARVEWLLHGAGDAADAQRDLGSFALLAERDPQALRLQLGPGSATLVSAYPVVSQLLDIAHAHTGSAETALVWRDGWQPRVRACATGEADFIAALQASRSLADALQAAPDFDFNAWLEPAVHSGLLVAVAPL